MQYLQAILFMRFDDCLLSIYVNTTPFSATRFYLFACYFISVPSFLVRSKGVHSSNVRLYLSDIAVVANPYEAGVTRPISGSHTQPLFECPLIDIVGRRDTGCWFP